MGLYVKFREKDFVFLNEKNLSRYVVVKYGGVGLFFLLIESSVFCILYSKGVFLVGNKRKGWEGLLSSLNKGSKVGEWEKNRWMLWDG